MKKILFEVSISLLQTLSHVARVETDHQEYIKLNKIYCKLQTAASNWLSAGSDILTWTYFPMVAVLGRQANNEESGGGR